MVLADIVVLSANAVSANAVSANAVSANAWMLAVSVLDMLLMLLSNISSFSTFRTCALHKLLESRLSLLHPTL